MTDRLAGIAYRLAELRKFAIRTREETTQEREDALDKLWSQMLQEEKGSQRCHMAFAAYTGLRRLEERRVLVIFGNDTPLWFPPHIK